jgi:plastocyanin
MGRNPLFSHNWIRNLIMIVTLFSLMVSPAPPFSPRLVRGTGSNYSVMVVDYAFQPLHINITTGITVVWSYASNGKTIHTVTSDQGRTRPKVEQPY